MSSASMGNTPSGNRKFIWKFALKALSYLVVAAVVIGIVALGVSWLQPSHQSGQTGQANQTGQAGPTSPSGQALKTASNSGGDVEYVAVQGPTNHAGAQIAFSACTPEPSRRAHITLALRLHNEDKLDQVLAERLGSHRRQLPRATVDEDFLRQFAPTEDEVAQVVQFLRGKELSNIFVSHDRLLVSADTSVATAETTFRTRLTCLYSEKYGSALLLQDDVNVPKTLGNIVASVLGLQTIHLPSTNAPASTSSIPIAHTPTELSAIYGADRLPAARDISIGIVAFGDVRPAINDLRYFLQANPSAAPSEITTVAAASSDPTQNGNWEPAIEWQIDSQSILGMAGGAKNLVFYTVPQTAAYGTSQAYVLEAINTAVNDSKNAVSVVNVSLGECEVDVGGGRGQSGDNEVMGDAPTFKEAEYKGITIVVSSGDHGAYECRSGATATSWPAASAHVVAVGATKLFTIQTTWNGEVVWNSCPVKSPSYLVGNSCATGGGPSVLESMPVQQRPFLTRGPGNARGVPDIVMAGDPNTGALIYVNGKIDPTSQGGTSLSAALFSGAWARVLQSCKECSGFAGGWIYTLPNADFHDVTVGNNGKWPATRGWDYSSGRGSPDICQVTKDLVKASNVQAGSVGSTTPTC